MNTEKESRIDSLEKQETVEGIGLKEAESIATEGTEMMGRVSAHAEKAGIDPERTKLIFEKTGKRLTQLRNAAVFALLAHGATAYAENAKTEKIDTGTVVESVANQADLERVETLPTLPPLVLEDIDIPPEIQELTTPQVESALDGILDAAQLRLKKELDGKLSSASKLASQAGIQGIIDEKMDNVKKMFDETADVETRLRAGVDSASSLPGPIKRIAEIAKSVLEFKKDLTDIKPFPRMGRRLLNMLTDLNTSGYGSMALDALFGPLGEPRTAEPTPREPEVH